MELKRRQELLTQQRKQTNQLEVDYDEIAAKQIQKLHQEILDNVKAKFTKSMNTALQSQGDSSLAVS